MPKILIPSQAGIKDAEAAAKVATELEQLTTRLFKIDEGLAVLAVDLPKWDEEFLFASFEDSLGANEDTRLAVVAVKQKIDEGRQHEARLHAARTVCVAKIAETRAEARRLELKAAHGRIKSVLVKRQQQADRVAATIHALVQEWREMRAIHDDLAMKLPPGFQLPADAYASPASFDILLASELYRLSGVAGSLNGEGAIPGAATTFEFRQQHDKITPLVDQVKRTNEYIERELNPEDVQPAKEWPVFPPIIQAGQPAI